MKKLTFILITLLLTGCMNAAVTSAQVVYDRHNLKKTLNDHYTSMRANQAVYLNTDEYTNTHVSIETFNGIILLTGQAPEESQREGIEEIVKKLAPNSHIYNHITLSAPSSSLIRLSDSWITTKVTSQIIASNDITPSQIKVVTENGTVYLMGILPKEQGEAAIKIARKTAGVQAVVKIFSWLKISKA